MSAHTCVCVHACRIMDTAKDTLTEALPIKCLEAVFLGAYLSCG